MAKNDDPLAGVEGSTIEYCRKCERPWGLCPCIAVETDLIYVEALPEPAVRKVMVEWLREEARDWVGHCDDSPTTAIHELADRLEAGGGERGGGGES